MRGRGGATLIELLVALAIFALVTSLGAAVVDTQREALRDLAGASRARVTLRHAATALGTDLRGAATADHLPVLTDSAVEFFTALGESVVCGAPAADGALLLPPLSRSDGAPLTWWSMRPEPGDRVLLLDDADSAGGRWRGATVATLTTRIDPAACAPEGGYTSIADATAPRLAVQLTTPVPPFVGAGTAVRIVRRVRYSLYRGGDGLWQLGYRRCPSDLALPCGGVQPVAGPLRAYHASPARSGLHLSYVDESGAPVTAAAAARLAAIRIVLRAPRGTGSGAADAASDSVVTWLAMRNRP